MESNIDQIQFQNPFSNQNLHSTLVSNTFIPKNNLLND